MNRSVALGILVGLAAGLVVGALVAKSRAAEVAAAVPKPPPPAPPAPVEVKPDPEVATLRARVTELEAMLAAKIKVETAPDPEDAPPDAASKAAESDNWIEKFEDLIGQGLGAYGRRDFNKLVELLKKAGPKALAELSNRLLHGATANERFFAAALMEGIGDPAAIPALTQSLQKEKEWLARRMSSHALAIIGTEVALAPLRAAMAEDKDWGVRINSAYGVAKQGQADGQKVLEGFYTSATSSGEEKLVSLFVLAEVAAPSSAPIFRKILSESAEATNLLAAIGAVEKMKDTMSLGDLNRIASDAKYPSKVREAARKAADALAK